MTFLGCLLLHDPPKSDIDRTINGLESLGITLKMITGDSLPVAASITQALGLVGSQPDTTKSTGSLLALIYYQCLQFSCHLFHYFYWQRLNILNLPFIPIDRFNLKSENHSTSN
jgi:magnesium-transporting ATPase (P-type)